MNGMMSKVAQPWNAWMMACIAMLFLAGTSASAEMVYGTAVSLREGIARTYALLDDKGNPIELGVALNEPFMEALPAPDAPGATVMPDGRSTFEYLLTMPERNPTPFRYVTLDWNPTGHIPLGVYDRPHFDVHFYILTNEERLTIRPDDPKFMEKARRLPAREYTPPGYMDLGTPPVPLMGLHLLNPSSPELRKAKPQPFTHTFIYGSWDGRLIFLEPMVTTEFLSSHPDVMVSVPMAERYQPKGLYPGAYRVRWDPASSEYRIALTDFRERFDLVRPSR